MSLIEKLKTKLVTYQRHRANRIAVKKSGGVPGTLSECFPRLEKLLTPENVKHFSGMKERDAVADYHRPFGMWLRNNWNLWSGGPLAVWFKERGIIHADDMYGILMTSFHRHLNGKDLEVDKQIDHYRNYWHKMGVNPDTMSPYHDEGNVL